ncbi:hypothetical protein [Haloferula sargassicola]|uniref:CARDB domain-containing protein n=1 Tax=Haloferula sargassicola TaxID=490096 RepID=A0ABP9UQV4_9BACT
MNIILSRLLAALLMGSPIFAADPGSFLDVSAKVEGKASYKDVKGSSTRTKTQNRTLKIEISNLGKEDVPATKVKWTVFGHRMKDHKLVELKSGESTVVVPGRDKVELSSAEVKVTGTREHTVSVRKRSRGKTRTTSQKVPASGVEYFGYAVEVYVSGQLVASEYSQPSLEKELHPGKETKKH